MIFSCDPRALRWNDYSTKNDELRDDSLQFIYHVGRGRNPYSGAEAGFWQEEKSVKKEGKQSSSLLLILSTAMQTVHHQIRWRPEQDSVLWIHLSTAQDAGLEFWQTGSNAIITYQSVPKESVVKVVSESGKRKLFARQLTHRKGSKVTLRASWVHARSNNLREPRETESVLQTGNYNPNSSGSRFWPKKEYEQSVDLRVDGIPNDETYKYEQYMQRIAEQVQKFVDTERILKEDSPEDKILS